MCFETRLFDIGPEVCDCRSKLKVPMNPGMRYAGRGRLQKTLSAGDFFVPANGFELAHTHTHTHAGTDNWDLLSMIVHFFLSTICPFSVDIDILRSFHPFFSRCRAIFECVTGVSSLQGWCGQWNVAAKLWLHFVGESLWPGPQVLQ